jgi:Domain of unknown function (DUF1707)
MAMRYYAPFPGSDSSSGNHGERPRPRGGPQALRVGDAERDAAAADLGEHYAAGRLSLDELNERLDAVFASKTLGQLTRIMADLPGTGRLPWRVRYWGPDDFADPPFDRTRSSMAGFQTRGPQAPPTPSDRAGRVAALSLLLLAMLIWLFTALLFARHGFYHSYNPYGGPPGTFSHFMHNGFPDGTGPSGP